MRLTNHSLKLDFFCCRCFFVCFLRSLLCLFQSIRALCVISCSRFSYYLILIKTPPLVTHYTAVKSHNQSLHAGRFKHTHKSSNILYIQYVVRIDKNHTGDRTLKLHTYLNRCNLILFSSHTNWLYVMSLSFCFGIVDDFQNEGEGRRTTIPSIVVHFVLKLKFQIGAVAACCVCKVVPNQAFNILSNIQFPNMLQ